MDREILIRNIHIGLRGLNGGMGCWDNVRRGLEKMDMEELVEFNQLILSIQTTQSAREQKHQHLYYGNSSSHITNRR